MSRIVQSFKIQGQVSLLHIVGVIFFISHDIEDITKNVIISLKLDSANLFPSFGS